MIALFFRLTYCNTWSVVSYVCNLVQNKMFSIKDDVKSVHNYAWCVSVIV